MKGVIQLHKSPQVVTSGYGTAANPAMNYLEKGDALR
jgi:hypothetical protein